MVLRMWMRSTLIGPCVSSFQDHFNPGIFSARFSMIIQFICQVANNSLEQYMGMDLTSSETVSIQINGFIWIGF